ncbi:MAG: hypothetical protein LW832_00765 [Parachlamydia sp.]|jgi:uncharacterized coiled-coil DUF342 family protein|nr:hypothetical protein [Parachlamydia sp.]
MNYSNNNITSSSTVNTICQSAFNIYCGAVVLNKVVKETVNSPCRVATMLASGAMGVNSIFNGDIFTGGLCAALAYKEGINIYSSQDNKSEINRLLKDAKAGMEMVDVLGEENKKSFAFIDYNLNLVSENVSKLTLALQEVQAIAASDCAKLNEQKNIASSLYQEADQLFKKAQKKLQTSQLTISNAHQDFVEVVKGMEELVQTAPNLSNDDELKAFIKASKKIHKQAKKASKKLEKANPRFEKGLQLLAQAMEKKDRASFEAGKALQMAIDHSEKIAQAATVEGDYQKEITTISDELNHIQERNQNAEQLLKESAKNIEEAEKKNEEAWGWQSILIGGSAGALIGNAAFGPLGLPGGLMAGGKAYHERKSIIELVAGKTPPPVPADPTTDQPVTWEFNAQSTGIWARYVKQRQSYTCGQAAILLGDNVSVKFTFNLNHKQPISQKDLCHLGNLLISQLKEKKISKEYAAKVLKQLESLHLDRGGYHKTATGLIHNGSSGANYLWNIVKMINSEK